MLNKWRSFFPAPFQALFVRLFFVLVVLTITRIIFYQSNSGSFSHVGLNEWLAGVWFDAITTALLFLPFAIFSLLPVPFREKRWYSFICKVCFFIPLLFNVALNLLDTEYFDFTQKRSTADLLAIVSSGNDIGQLLTTFITDFWPLIVCFVLLVIATGWFYKRTAPRTFKKADLTPSRTKELLVFVCIMPFFILVGRGGFDLKPVNIIDATLYTKPQNTALILNSAFTIIKSYGKDDLEIKNYFPPETADKLFNPIHQTTPQHVLADKTNVMIIMLESFGNEWVGAFNDSTSYTPFFDSLIGESWTFEYGFSNGKKSIEGVPAITASLPTLMDNPYISSPYCNNKIRTLPNILEENGYSTAFFHGATNGSMRFNSFAKQAGFDKYVGRFEYNNDDHFDLTWGILDEYFNPWTARQLTKMKAPFFATLFTLSSHHPYYIPPRWKNKLKKGKYPINQSISYGDMSLRNLFEQAKKEPWYNNTLFVLVADHTASTSSTFYSQRTQMYRIPIVFFHPGGKLPKKKEKTIFQQIDIMPTVLDLVNVDTKYYAFGQSYYGRKQPEAITYLEGTYYYFRGTKMLSFSNDKAIGLLDFTTKKVNDSDSLKAKKQTAKSMEKRLKAIIQRYNNDLIHNQTRVK